MALCQLTESDWGQVIESYRSGDPLILLTKRWKTGPITIKKHLTAAGLPIGKPGARHGAANPRWNGGRTLHDHGYVLVRAPEHHRAHRSGYVYEHILIAEQKAGRPILRSEHVHHGNEIKSDNGPDNLEPMTAAQHRRHHAEERRKLKQPPACMYCGCAVYAETRSHRCRRCAQLRRPRGWSHSAETREKISVAARARAARKHSERAIELADARLEIADGRVTVS